MLPVNDYNSSIITAVNEKKRITNFKPKSVPKWKLNFDRIRQEK